MTVHLPVCRLRRHQHAAEESKVVLLRFSIGECGVSRTAYGNSNANFLLTNLRNTVQNREHTKASYTLIPGNNLYQEMKSNISLLKGGQGLAVPV